MSVRPLEMDRCVAVGRVTPRTVRLWMRSVGGGLHRLSLWPEGTPSARREFTFDAGDRSRTDHTYAFNFPEDIPGGMPLEPVTRYGFEISRLDDTSVGVGRFETLPASASHMPRQFSIGVASCHQPFNKEGSMHEPGIRMLRLARTAWERADVKQVLWVGDQLYIDFPETRSIFDEAYFRTVGPSGRKSMLECTEDEAAEMYHQRYRTNWSHPAWQALQARFPGYPILDDHEVVDNYGSLPEHHSEKWQHIRNAAGRAYRNYQHSRVEPSPPDFEGPFDYTFEYGALAGYVLDVRSMRRSTDGENARVFAPHQKDRFSRWLNANAHAPVLFVVVSVPPFFMPGWMSRLARRIPGNFREDAHDRWMHPQYRKDRRWLLETLRAHQERNPRQKVCLVAGDVHVGYASRCDWRTDPKTSLYQFVSSSITHLMADADWALARHVPRTHFALFDLGERWARVHLLGGRMSRVLEQPVGGLNVGVIDVDLSEDVARLNFRLFGEDEDDPDQPKCLYESGFE